MSKEKTAISPVFCHHHHHHNQHAQPFHRSMTDESRLDQQILKMLEKSIRTCDEATSATEFEHVVSDASDAIEQYNLRILDLLDVRSRANCEMGNYDDALKDALDMMERAPQSIKGYHRAGRVYAAQKEVKEALECYAKGLAIATDRDRMYDIIQLAFDSISDGMEQTVFAWANAGEFRKALRLSERMVDGAPTSPRGYLWAGTIYMMRGMMGKAITYFQRGMDNASRFDHLYIKLKQKRLEAERRRDARMDVILLLPYDILSCVLPYLSTLDLMVCIEVSSLWRERILRCPEAWSCVDITDESVVPILGTIGPYVQQLQARFRSSHGLTALILGGVLPNIRKLELVMVDVPDRKEFMKGLARLRNTLDEVILSMIHVEHTHFPSPTEMLAICPNIKRFVYASNLYPVRTQLDWPEHMNLLRLTHFRIQLMDPGIGPSEIEPILRRAPNLVWLVLDGCTPETMRMAQAYCPMLMHMGVNTVDEDDMLDVNDRWPLEDVLREQQRRCRSSQPGIRSLEVYNAKSDMGGDEVLPYLSRASHSLEFLTLGDRFITRFPSPRWDTLCQWSSPSLHTIQCSLNCSDEVIGPILSGCPALENVTFHRMRHISDEILARLLRLRRLCRLALRSCRNMTAGGMDAFFAKLRAADPARPIAVEFFDMVAITDQTLLTLATIPCFRDLTLSMCRRVTTSGMGSFMDRLRDSGHRIDRIYLNHMQSVGNENLFKLGRIHRLKRIELRGLDGISNGAVLGLATASAGYQKMVYVDECRHITKDVLAYIQDCNNNNAVFDIKYCT